MNLWLCDLPNLRGRIWHNIKAPWVLSALLILSPPHTCTHLTSALLLKSYLIQCFKSPVRDDGLLLVTIVVTYEGEKKLNRMGQKKGLGAYMTHISHPSSNQVGPWLASEVRWDWAHSGWYDHRQMANFCLFILGDGYKCGCLIIIH